MRAWEERAKELDLLILTGDGVVRVMKRGTYIICKVQEIDHAAVSISLNAPTTIPLTCEEEMTSLEQAKAIRDCLEVAILIQEAWFEEGRSLYEPDGKGGIQLRREPRIPPCEDLMAAGLADREAFVESLMETEAKLERYGDPDSGNLRGVSET